MDGTWCKVGRNQLLAWMKSGRVTDPNADWFPYVPEVGDTVAVGCARGEHVYIRAAVGVEEWESGDEDYDIWLTDQFQHRGFDIWDVVDDSGECEYYGYCTCELCGRWVLSSELYGEIVESLDACDYSVVCCDERACSEFRTRKEQLKTLEALRQLRDAGDFPIPAIVPDQPTCIRYDVFRYDHALGRFLCCGSNLRYADAHDICRKCERMGHVAYLAESQAVVSNG